MTHDADVLLTFRDVTFGYHHNKPPVLAQVNFSLRAGRVLAVVGPNGAGKTTLLALALGWLRPWQGDILLAGRPIHSYGRDERGRWLALVPQSEHTPFDYSALEYVLMGRAPHLPPLGSPGPTDYALALDALALVGISTLADRPIPQLSGGERQLMLLARAVAQQPRLMLLDEPTAHLDLHNKFRLIQIMRRLRAQGVTLVMTNHEPDVVLAVADDVLLMEPGRPPEFGMLAEVFTEDALSRIYRLPIRLVNIDGRRQVVWT
ncbi:MAG: ABC transporter ATP-binding protein [Thermoflexales bacterium]|nr:ABC transporter ATP-binding protein [Thermoflexales bacterium]MDW8351319.1 ABC transporter ATP-binding protein [Anaerolineae bacterium]